MVTSHDSNVFSRPRVDDYQFTVEVMEEKMTDSQLSRRALLGGGTAAATAVAISTTSPSAAQAKNVAIPRPPKQPQMVGAGGAVSSVSPEASQVGIDVLRNGGNAVDAAVATCAALGVTYPFNTGIGGGGFFVYYEAKSGKITTIDGRETAPASFDKKTFTDKDGEPLDFADVVASGLSVGVPGNPATWDTATRRWGSQSLNSLLKPAERLAAGGFTADQQYHDYVVDNAEKFRIFPETTKIYLHDDDAPAVGSRIRNPDMARAYRALRIGGPRSLYNGPIGAAIVDTVRHPSTVGKNVHRGELTRADLRRYSAPVQNPTHSKYHDFDVYGMDIPSSGGIAVGEGLNLLEAYDRQTGTSMSSMGKVQYAHRFAEASATAFADRNRYVGDVANVPKQELLSQRFADQRARELFDPHKAHTRPIPFGHAGGHGSGSAQHRPKSQRGATTHLTTADQWGNVVSFTSTIEQIGGSGITVPGYGFLLNNELTDFDFAPLTSGVPDPNLPGPGKRPTSSMSPTIVLDHDGPVLATGAAGGATIITSVFQVLTGVLDQDHDLVDALAAPRLSSRNGSKTEAEPGIAHSAVGDGLQKMGHKITKNDHLSTATGIKMLDHGRFEAAAETTRSDGGSARVVHPAR